jgi:polyribonucleotide nucleotidyltransferase
LFENNSLIVGLRRRGKFKYLLDAFGLKPTTIFMEQKTFSCEVGGKTITIETGKFAQSADASCTVRCGDTVILATAVMSKETKADMGFFPLMVDFEERLYAAGRIKGSRFIKREGRPTDEAVLVGRFIDRAIRPLFDERLRNEVQVIVTALSFDGENDPDILGLIGASCALHISDIPWNGPIGALRISQKSGNWMINPSYELRKTTDFDLDLAGTTKKIIMIEARADEVDEDTMAKAFEFGMKNINPIIKMLDEARTAVGKEKADILEPSTDEQKAKLEHENQIIKISEDFMRPIFEDQIIKGSLKSKKLISQARHDLEDKLVEFMKKQGSTDEDIRYAINRIYEFTQREASRLILEQGKRVDGRSLTQVRQLVAEVGLLPRVHGSGMFMRGTTQVLSICTLGAPGDEQTLDGMELVGQKRYIHHYNFPPFSVGEAKALRGTGRREIGHGALAEKALESVIPTKEDFPYTIRVVSEVLDSNGSSSMASTCASTLALMDAGVPIKTPIAGIAIGLATNGNDWKVLTDLQDIEDGHGGMDFKITGSKTGITAIQMDTKTDGLSIEMIKQALTQAYNARIEILEVIEKSIPGPRAELSQYAPRIIKIRINPEKIREVIGSGGKTINEIIEKTGVTAIDIEQDGLVFITSVNADGAQQAQKWIEDITRELKVGETFTGKVERLMDFGAIVSILPGRDGMVHVSELAPWRVEKVSDIVNIGDEVKVKIIEIDSVSGKTSLSMKQAEGNVYTEEMKAKAQKQASSGFSKQNGHKPNGYQNRPKTPRTPHQAPQIPPRQ